MKPFTLHGELLSVDFQHDDCGECEMILHIKVPESMVVTGKCHVTLGVQSESEYAKALRTGVKPDIWPPIFMNQEELAHFQNLPNPQ